MRQALGLDEKDAAAAVAAAPAAAAVSCQLLWTRLMLCGWVVLDGGAVMLDGGAVMLILVFTLPPLTAAACVLRLLQKYFHHAALAICGS